jgi:hypothetical protein
MSKPIAIAKGIAFAFPDVCKTPAPPGPPIPIPYPNIAQLDTATPLSNDPGKALLVGPSGDPVLLLNSEVPTSSGDEAGSVGGVKSGTIKGKCTMVQASGTVLYGSQQKGIVRFLDRTEQNNGNAQGMVLSAFPTVLVGD